MKLVIVQASDIHLSTEKYPVNPVLDRVPQIAAAIRSLFLPADDVGGCFLLMTGDIAYAGLKSEYALAKPFVKSIEANLGILFPAAEHRTFFIPGNHDCNFDDDDEARRKLIADPDPDSLADGSIVAVATAIQENFFDFTSSFGASSAVAGLDRIHKSHSVNIKDRVILVQTLNSAWTSRMHEGRDLILPVKYLSTQFAALSPPPAVVVTMLHHPYNWFEPNNARALRTLLEQTSDVILTGHEHSSSTYTKTGLTGEQNEYVEGGVLQENGDPNSSSFNVVVIDLANATQEVHQFAWNGTLYDTVNEPVSQPFIRNKYRLKSSFALDPAFEDVLNDMEAPYTHPYKDHILLDDVFIYPDLREFDDTHSKATTRLINGRDVVNHVLKKKRVIIVGADRSGKSAIGKSLFKDLQKNGAIPLLLSGRDLNSGAIRKLQRTLDGAFSSQYDGNLKAEYWRLPAESRAVIVDDYHKLPMTKEMRDMLVKGLLDRFSVVIVLAGTDLRVQELIGHDRESRLLWTFNHCEVLGFGHRLRAEFIKRWYRIGRHGNVNDVEATQDALALERTISSVLGHNLLPPYPSYLLLLLQTLEARKPHDTNTASYARLYGAVVTGYLAKSGAADDLETKINYLSELAFHLYTLRQDHLSNEDALKWHSLYCDRHLEILDFTTLRDELVIAHVLQIRDGHIRFRYRACYYYFVAMYLSDNLAKEPIRAEIKQLCTRLHREEAANIVIFLCHRSKDTLILDSVLGIADGLYTGLGEVEFPADASFTTKLMETVAAPVLEETDPEKNRLQSLEERDQMLQTATDDTDYEHRVEDDEVEEDSEFYKALTNLNAAIKTIQIAGQILRSFGGRLLRSFGGRLEGDQKTRMAEACYGLSMRLMKHYYAGFEREEAAFIESLATVMHERRPGIDKVTARKLASAFVYALLRQFTLGVIDITSNAIGLEKLAPVFSEVLKLKPTLPRKFLDLSIRLDHYKAFPIDQTYQIQKDVKDSVILMDVLRQLVFNRFYFFAAPADVKQSVCKKLDIKIQPVLLDSDYKRNA